MTKQEKQQFLTLFTLLTDYETLSIFDWKIQSIVRDVLKYNLDNKNKLTQENVLVAIDMLLSKYWNHPDTKPE